MRLSAVQVLWGFDKSCPIKKFVENKDKYLALCRLTAASYTGRVIMKKLNEFCTIVSALILCGSCGFIGASIAGDADVKSQNKKILSDITALEGKLPVDLIISFKVNDAQLSGGISELDARKEQFSHLKRDQILAKFSLSDIDVLTDYEYLPAIFARVKNQDTLAALATNPFIESLSENLAMQPYLAKSLPLIKRDLVPSTFSGAGTAVAVIDSGVDYTKPDFGSCSAPGSSNCRVVEAVEIATQDNQLDSNGHGTNVAAIIANVAPGTKIISLDAYGNAFSPDDLNKAINWVLANQAKYNIVAVNMSLGSSMGVTSYTFKCDNINPLQVAMAQLKAAGIAPVVASGNEGYYDRISMPACSTAAISVGMVFDSNVGKSAGSTLDYVYPSDFPRPQSTCVNDPTAADLVPCWANISPWLDLLAPGGIITAGGFSMSGTSQAAPHVSGAVALLRGTQNYQFASVDDIKNRLSFTGKSIDVTRKIEGSFAESYVGSFPRINLQAALENLTPLPPPVAPSLPPPAPVASAFGWLVPVLNLILQ